MNLVKLQWLHPIVRPDNQKDEYWDNLIHPEDLGIAYSNKFNSYIFYVEGVEKEYVVIKQQEFKLRVKATALQSIPYEGFYLQDKVSVVSKRQTNSEKQGVIKRIAFHYKENRLFYQLTDTKGKIISKRYFSDDLEKLEQ